MGRDTCSCSLRAVRAVAEIAADWRDEAAYAPLLDADRALFAWEWLRRDLNYRRAADLWLNRSAGSATSVELRAREYWGLHVFERPWLGVPAARPIWSADAHAHVLSARVEPCAPGDDSLDLREVGSILTHIRTEDGRGHLLFSDGYRSIRLDLLAGWHDEGPMLLHYRLAGFASAEKPLLALRRLTSLRRTGGFSRMLHAPEVRARRWVLLLRVHDALQAGADQRRIAGELLSSVASEAKWRSEAPSLRSQVQRLVRNAKSMAAGGYRRLLR